MNGMEEFDNETNLDLDTSHLPLLDSNRGGIADNKIQSAEDDKVQILYKKFSYTRKSMYAIMSASPLSSCAGGEGGQSFGSI